MAQWHEVLSYVYNGEAATGIGEPADPQYPLGNANRTSVELLDNDNLLSLLIDNQENDK